MTLKHSLEIVTSELELIGKKRQALIDLIDTGKISQSTYDYINTDLTNAMSDIEAQRKTLADKITSRANELENQLKSLEMFLANLEIHYVANEIDDSLYKNQRDAVVLGLEATRQEINDTKEVLGKLIPEAETSFPSVPVPVSPINEELEKEETMTEDTETTTDIDQW